jgi:hypothetical protein
MLDPVQYEFLFLFTTLADPEPEPGAGAETLIFRLWLQPKVPAPCGSGSSSTTLVKTIYIPTSPKASYIPVGMHLVLNYYTTKQIAQKLGPVNRRRLECI